MRIFIKKEGINNQRKEDSFFSRENGRMHEKELAIVRAETLDGACQRSIY